MALHREIRTTADGSSTLHINELNENYHSGHGALQEARHVFIENGLKLTVQEEINILELGFGTGLNFLVTAEEFLQNEGVSKINYFSLEKYPVTIEEAQSLNYHQLFQGDFEETFYKIHVCDWEETVVILPEINLKKFQCDFFNLENLDIPLADLVYFDCFGARVQPDLWETPLLKMVRGKMRPGGLFTTYASKGSLRRNLRSLGFEVQKRPGPPGKREMCTARLLDE